MAASLSRRGLRAAAVLVATALLVSACGSADQGSAGAMAQAGRGVSSPANPSASGTAPGQPSASDPTPTDPGSSDPLGLAPSAGSGGGPAAAADYSRVVLAGGVRQWIHCAGSGPLTVVVVPGLGSSHDDWAGALPGMQAVTRACVYDRPGLGSSPPRSAPGQVVDAGLHARELHALLRAAGERGPYVVVGHSYGGLVARAFVHLYASEVRGVLLAESATPGDLSSGTFWTEAGHRVDLVASARADAGGPAMGALPLLVLSASDAPTELWRQQQAADTRLSTDSVQVVARSGHLVMQDDPAAVVAATRALVQAGTGAGRLACTAGWAGLGATCR